MNKKDSKFTDDDFFTDNQSENDNENDSKNNSKNNDTIIFNENFSDLTKNYIDNLKKKNKSNDMSYGVRMMTDGTLKVGDSIIEFGENEFKIKNSRYDKTPGLIQLLFLKEPDDKVVTSADLDTYTKIVKSTNAHKKYYLPNEEIRKEKKNKKYNNYISKMIDDLAIGSGLAYKVARPNTYMDYVHWDDPNELVERLRLLIAETSAGNQSHINEIQSILEELREANIIY